MGSRLAESRRVNCSTFALDDARLWLARIVEFDLSHSESSLRHARAVAMRVFPELSKNLATRCLFELISRLAEGAKRVAVAI
jgi:hypothetical protein